MTTYRHFLLVLCSATAICALGACASTHAGHAVESSGTPVNPFADPGAADQPSAPLTGSQSQRR